MGVWYPACPYCRFPLYCGAGGGAGARARFLVISAEGRSEQLARAAGAEGFLAKPLDVRRMMGEVERLFALAPR